MFVTVNNDVALFRTKFSRTHDLVQKFRGFNNTTINYNAPIDFMEAGLIDNSKRDIFHLDIPFSISTDEVPPLLFNGELLGGNHSPVVAIRVVSHNHSLSYKDISSKWIDKVGNIFYLYRIVNDSVLNFVSHNVGKDELNFNFIKNIEGDLQSADNNTKIKVSGQMKAYFSRSNKYINKKIYTYKDGIRSELFFSAECDYAEIVEEYEIVNPATVVNGLISKRPKDGYTFNPDISYYGKPMFSVKLIYRVLSDGAILTIFDINAIQDVKIDRYMGAMFQEKLDIYGGGMFRYIPKLLPFNCPDGKFDFSNPINLYGGGFPLDYYVTKDSWENSENPPDRVIDVFKDSNGNSKLGYTCGFLPVYDGEPSIRKNISYKSFHIYSSRKAYPFFFDVAQKKIKGVSYKKFFTINNNSNFTYTIPYEGCNYCYTDIFDDSSISMQFKGEISLLEASKDLGTTIDSNNVKIDGKKGYVVIKEELK